MQNNKSLYNNIIYNISEGVKHALNKFNITDYQDDTDIIDQHTIESTINEKDVYDTNILWSDLNVYTLYDIVNDIPQSGEPIGINIIDNKYVSLKYMSEQTPEEGSIFPIKILFSKYDIDINGIQCHNDIKNDNISDLQSKLIKDQNGNIFYKTINKQDFQKIKYFNGKKQTQLISNNMVKAYDCPAVAVVQLFNPGNTKKGDWYIPEIGELCIIYILYPVINYICQILSNKGYEYYIYNKIKFLNQHLSSTFSDYNLIYCMSMEGYIQNFFKDTHHIVLAMYELNN